MSCRPDGYVDLWQKVACNRQLWRFKKLPNGFYTISVNGETNPGKVFFSGDKNSKKVLLTAEDPSSKTQQWELTPIENGMFNIRLPNGMSPNATFLSCRADGWVDMWVRDDNSGR